MREEVKIGDRIIILSCGNKRDCKILEFFLNVLETYKKDIKKLMDQCEIPQEIDLNFKPGDGKLDGMYHVQKKAVSEHIVLIDIFTGHLKGIRKEEDVNDLMKNLLETFLHELMHHKHVSEKRTDRKAKNLVKKILGKIR